MVICSSLAVSILPLVSRDSASATYMYSVCRLSDVDVRCAWSGLPADGWGGSIHVYGEWRELRAGATRPHRRPSRPAQHPHTQA